MSDHEERLYGLMEIAERQQATVQQVLDGLVAERGALAQDRAALGRETRTVARGAQDAVHGAMREIMADCATTAADALRRAVQPLLGAISGATANADMARDSIQELRDKLSTRLLVGFLGAIAAFALAGALISSAVMWWVTDGIRATRLEEAGLESQVEALQATRDELKANGADTMLQHCGKDGRLCLATDETAGAFSAQGQTYRVIQGH